MDEYGGPPLPQQRVEPKEANYALTDKERAVILQGQDTREDGQEVILKPHGNEAEVYALLKGNSFYLRLNPENARYWAEAQTQIVGKRCLVVPAYSSNAFMFREVGASVTVGIDADPTTVAWLKAINQYGAEQQLDKLLLAATDWEDVDELITVKQRLQQAGYQEGYQALTTFLKDALRDAIQAGTDSGTHDDLIFQRAALGVDRTQQESVITQLGTMVGSFDFLYVPYILGITNGIESPAAITRAYEDLWDLAAKNAIVMVRPFTTDPDHPHRARNFDSVEVLVPPDKFQVEYVMHIGGAAAGFLRVLK